jgi:hypothetical protein
MYVKKCFKFRIPIKGKISQAFNFKDHRVKISNNWKPRGANVGKRSGEKRLQPILGKYQRLPQMGAPLICSNLPVRTAGQNQVGSVFLPESLASVVGRQRQTTILTFGLVYKG